MNFEKRDVVYGKVVCNIKAGCFVETERGNVFLPHYNFEVGTFLYGTIVHIPEEIGKCPVIILDSVRYADGYLVA